MGPWLLVAFCAAGVGLGAGLLIADPDGPVRRWLRQPRTLRQLLREYDRQVRSLARWERQRRAAEQAAFSLRGLCGTAAARRDLLRQEYEDRTGLVILAARPTLWSRLWR